MTHRPVDWPVAMLVPHAGNMSLLTAVLSGDEDSIRAEVLIATDSAFCNGVRVGAWVGIEYMAQAVAAWAGWQARLRGDAPRIGLLLGTRRYHARRDAFEVGERLVIDARCVFQADNGLGQFECGITVAQERVADAALTVFEPRDPRELMSRHV